MDDNHRDRIKECFDQLVNETNDLDLENMLKKFEEKKLFNQWMLMKIRSSPNPQKEFYERIQKRGPEAFENLKKALTEVGLHNLSLNLTGNRFFKECNYTNDNLHDLDGCLSRKKNSNSLNNDVNDQNNKYKLKSHPKGIVLIINIKTFKFKKDYDRAGSENDVLRLKKVWTNLGFKVKVKENFTSEELKMYLTLFVQKEKLRKVDSAFIFIMSHGKPNEDRSRIIKIECSDSQFVHSDDIINQFNSINCPLLAEKPKVIFFQACRGDNVDKGLVLVVDSVGMDISTLRVKKVPHKSDLLVVYSTSPGDVSYRDEKNGGYFTQEFCNVLQEKLDHLDLSDVIDEVSRRLKTLALHEQGPLSGFQVVHSEKYGFDKHLYLNDK